MAQSEVEQAQLEQLQLAHSLLKKLEGSPKTRRKLLALVKEVNPEANIPELDAAEPVEKELQEVKGTLGKELETLKDQLREFKAESKSKEEIAEARARLRAAGWDADGIAKIEKTMIDRGLVDYDVAAGFVKSQIPSPDLSEKPFSYDQGWDFSSSGDGEDEETKAFLKKDWKRGTKLAVEGFFRDKAAGRV